MLKTATTSTVNDLLVLDGKLTENFCHTYQILALVKVGEGVWMKKLERKICDKNLFFKKFLFCFSVASLTNLL